MVDSGVELREAPQVIKKDRGAIEIPPHRGVSIVRGLIDNDAITPTPSVDQHNNPRSFSINIDKVITSLADKQSESPQQKIEITPEEREMLQKEAQEEFTRVRQLFIDKGLLPQSIRKEADHLLTAQDISVIDYAHGGHGSSDSSSGKRDSIELGVGLVESELTNFRGKMKKLGIPYSEDQAQRYVLGILLSHEYGHVIDRILREWKIEQNTSKEERWKNELPIRLAMQAEVHTDIARDEGLIKVVGERIDNLESLNITQERIAMGFESVLSDALLQSIGFTSSQREQIVSFNQTVDEKRFNELSDFFHYASEKGWGIKQLEYALAASSGGLKESGKADLASSIPEFFGYNQLAYYKPLSESELKAYMERYGKPLKWREQIRRVAEKVLPRRLLTK